MEDKPSLVFQILGSILILGAALGAGLLFAPVGLFAALVLVIIWYVLFGHHAVSWMIDRIFRMSRMDMDPCAKFERKIRRLMENKSFEEALHQCRQWMRHDCENATPHLIISQILADQQGNLQSAIKEMELSVIRPFPSREHVDLALRLAELYRRVGREGEIEPIFRRIRGLHPRSPEIKRL